MKRKSNGGFSLVEIVVAMAILVSIVVPVCNSMLVSVRINAKAETVLKAKLAVSSAVEELMATGIPANTHEYTSVDDHVTVKVTPVPDVPYYNVEAWYTVDEDTEVARVSTTIRAAEGNGGTE